MDPVVGTGGIGSGRVLPQLTDEALCQVWRASYQDLFRARDAHALFVVYAGRAAMLDEMERRHPDGFRRWLDGGARAADDPARFLAPPQA